MQRAPWPRYLERTQHTENPVHYRLPASARTSSSIDLPERCTFLTVALRDLNVTLAPNSIRHDSAAIGRRDGMEFAGSSHGVSRRAGRE
jgi:hypothetical protein